jgi:DNA end-binding protein Ku
MIETLRYADEVQNAEQYFSAVPGAKPEKELLTLATELIERKVAPFNAKAFKDQYEVALRELIDAKMEHRAPQAIEEPELGAKVINLMEALKRSVKGGAPARGKAAAAAATPAPTKKGKAKTAKAKPAAKGRRAA